MSGGKAFERCRVKVMYVLCESETGVERRVSSGKSRCSSSEEERKGEERVERAPGERRREM